jgi:hypothetical protein
MSGGDVAGAGVEDAAVVSGGDGTEPAEEVPVPTGADATTVVRWVRATAARRG